MSDIMNNTFNILKHLSSFHNKNKHYNIQNNISQHKGLMWFTQLGYVHNGWLLILVIDNLLTIAHCATKYETITLPKSALPFCCSASFTP